MRSIIKDKTGSYADIFVFIIMSFIIVVFFGMMYYGFSKVDTVLTGIQITTGDGTGYGNFTNIVDDTWGEVFDAYAQLKIIAYVLIFGMIFSILVSSYMVKSPPIFLIIYIIISIVGIIAGASISNVYQGLLLNAEFGSTLQSFRGASYLLLYLPYLAGIVALFSGLLSLIQLNKSKVETGGGFQP